MKSEAHFYSHSVQLNSGSVPDIGIISDNLRLGILDPSLDKNPGHGCFIGTKVKNLRVVGERLSALVICRHSGILSDVCFTPNSGH
jgi:hypothetical protein